MNQKGFSNIILVLAVVVLAIVVGYFVLTKKSAMPVQTEQTQSKNQYPNKVAGWETYKNDKYGFILQYPKSVTFPEDFTYNFPSSNGLPTPFPIKKGTAYAVSIEGDPLLKGFQNKDSSTLDAFIVNPLLGVHLLIQKNPSGDLESFVKEKLRRETSMDNLPKDTSISTEKISQNDVNGFLTLVKYPISGTAVDYVYENYYFSNSTHLFIFSNYYQDRGNQITNGRVMTDILHQIISTFRFTN